MNLLRSFDIRAKTIIALLLVGSLSTLITAFLGYQNGRDNLTNQISAQLTGVREATAGQIKQYFDTTRAHVGAMSRDLMMVSAIREFTFGAGLVSSDQVMASMELSLVNFYEAQYAARLAKLSSNAPIAAAFQPDSSMGRYFQYHYISNNPNPLGEKQNLEAADDGSEYSDAHRKYHPAMSAIADALGYQDLFLIRPDGRIIYSVLKEVDFMSDLSGGPFSESGLARAFNTVRADKGSRTVHVEDYSFYQPSYGAPSAFMAAPIYDGTTLIGVLAVQLAAERINAMVSSNGNWKDIGMGDTGEIYLVGNDGLLRTSVRPFVENRKTFLELAREGGTDNQTLDRITAYGTPILLQGVMTEAIDAAIAGERDVHLIDRSYQGHQALSATAPLILPGLDWVIAAEMPIDEAYQPIFNFKRRVGITATFLSIMLTLVSMLLAGFFTKPLRELIGKARRVAAGDLNTDLQLSSSDEFSELAHSMQAVVDSLKERTQAANAERAQTEALLSRFLPNGVVREIKERIGKSDDLHVAQSIPSISLVMAEILGSEKIMAGKEPEAALSAIDDLIESIDAIADRHGVEKIRSASDRYFAASGLSTPHLDHDLRAIAFAIEVRASIQRYRHDNTVELRVRISVTTGAVLAGVVGRDKLVFDVWGAPVNEARTIVHAAKNGEIRVSPKFANRVKQEYEIRDPLENEPGGGLVLNAVPTPHKQPSNDAETPPQVPMLEAHA